MIRLFCPDKNPLSPHSEHSAVLPLTPHTISNKQTCQIEKKCMINRLWYDYFHIVPHINPRHPYQLEVLRPSGLYGCLGWYGAGYENCHIIISFYCPHAFERFSFISSWYTRWFIFRKEWATVLIWTCATFKYIRISLSFVVQFVVFLYSGFRSPLNHLLCFITVIIHWWGREPLCGPNICL